MDPVDSLGRCIQKELRIVLEYYTQAVLAWNVKYKKNVHLSLLN